MKKLGFFTAVLSVILISCKPSIKVVPEGGGCEYTKYEGIAKIKSITPAPSDEHNCPTKPMKIKFEFTPKNLSDRNKYKFKDYSDSVAFMTINDGANPSQLWIDKNKIVVGKEYKCFRSEVTKGTCSPVMFDFTELDLFPTTGCK